MIYLVLYTCIEHALVGFSIIGVGGGGSNFITYLSIIGIVIMLMGFMVCLICRYYCGEDQKEEDDDACKYSVHVIYF